MVWYGLNIDDDGTDTFMEIEWQFKHISATLWKDINILAKVCKKKNVKRSVKTFIKHTFWIRRT